MVFGSSLPAGGSVSTNQNLRSIGLRTATGEKDTAAPREDEGHFWHARSRIRSTWSNNTVDDVVSVLGLNRLKCSSILLKVDTSLLINTAKFIKSFRLFFYVNRMESTT